MEYKYINAPLTTAISKELILELFNDRLVLRKTIINEVIKTHQLRGGQEANVKNQKGKIKKALEALKREGNAINPVRGYWHIKNALNIRKANASEGEKANQAAENTEKIKDNFNADLILGKGTSAVYLYYLPGYEKNREKDTWACKIGKTDKDPLQRISSQASTALPEKPKVAIIIKTDNAHALEQAVHNILIYRKKNIDTAFGKEWFDTNPDEFLTIVQFISKSTLLFNM
ncbi:hypothetical protein A8F94_14485 [Bacillus sp. FJAT-27225]|uniref:GIY-YIG nuclease family protein n=1 Tax=Bacillus sp. FJAT-27225 TaxID=1743144 RepID=UPI00080C2685|nr:GIY-YIG nuclease family protein [Bacillus sp. FJAT-27225]OCA86045.1 hypothetical protein A8F94_14485 [Bacillus sp. FJAT-27225]